VWTMGETPSVTAAGLQFGSSTGRRSIADANRWLKRRRSELSTGRSRELASTRTTRRGPVGRHFRLRLRAATEPVDVVETDEHSACTGSRSIRRAGIRRDHRLPPSASSSRSRDRAHAGRGSASGPGYGNLRNSADGFVRRLRDGAAWPAIGRERRTAYAGAHAIGFTARVGYAPGGAPPYDPFAGTAPIRRSAAVGPARPVDRLHRRGWGWRGVRIHTCQGSFALSAGRRAASRRYDPLHSGGGIAPCPVPDGAIRPRVTGGVSRRKAPGPGTDELCPPSWM
jgi:hypothetical protein